ncbi:MAG: FAD-dependent oxidoreductase [Bacteroidota bacterium]
MQHYDYAVIGGGIFGCYAALFLAGRGASVVLIEKEQFLFRKASLVNQARLHSGYHYPRSLATAAMSDEHKSRFTAEHRAFVHASFEKYYAIDKYGSFTDPLQFERFCEYLNIRCDRTDNHPLFNYDRLEAVYRTEEHSFDPVLLGNYYSEKVMSCSSIDVLTGSRLTDAGAFGKSWQMTVQTPDKMLLLETEAVINATYAATNSINILFGLPSLALTHEISEIGFITSRQFGNMGLTVMDGPFGSIMPYGLSGLLSLSSVAYTHHAISTDEMPVFDCQTPEDNSCTPRAPGICTDCSRRPASNAQKMLSQMKRYFSDVVQFEYLFSYFTIKSKLQASYIDDGRPTEISMLSESPRFYCLFAGKINSIYEVEKIFR